MRFFKIYCLIFIQICYCQSTPVAKIQSPNTASLGIYGEIPVSLFTGTPNISIPLYTLKSGNITVPISLSYHPSSVKPSQQSGWVGLGWNLNCNGSITRTIRGAPDEFTNESNPNDQRNVPFYPYSGIRSGNYSGSIAIQESDWDKENWLASKIIPDPNTAVDLQADEFNFNFFGHSGYFYYDNGKWTVVSEENIVVEFNNEFIYPLDVVGAINSYNPIFQVAYSMVYQRSRSFKQFTLITDDGTRYTFGGIDAMEFTSPYIPAFTSYRSDTWLLKKIENSNHDFVNFEYAKRDYITCSLSYTGGSTALSSSIGYNDVDPQVNIVKNDLSGQYIFPLYLYKITSNNQNIIFDSSIATTLRYTDYQYNQRLSRSESLALVDYNPNLLQTKKLDRITVNNLNNSAVKVFNFKYNQSTTERFTLKNFDIDAIQNYSFIYDNVFELPGLEGDKTDHWGFFNNNSIFNANDTPVAASNMFNVKVTNQNYVTKGLLVNIKYPTGGNTQFTWEPHYHSKVVNQTRQALNDYNGYAGGSRINEIKTFDNTNVLISKKKYYYVKNYNKNTRANIGALTSSGVLNGIPKYNFQITRPEQNGTATLTKYSYNSITNYSYSSGSHIGYDEVVEVNTDGSFNKNYFTNFGVDANGISHYDQTPLANLKWIAEEDGPYMPTSTLDLERGKPLWIENYNTEGIMVQSNKNFYRADIERFQDTKNYIRRIRFDGLNKVGNISTTNLFLFTSAFKKYTYSYYPVKTENTTFDLNGNNGITATTTFGYNDKNQLSVKTIQTSVTNETKTIKMFYPPYGLEPYHWELALANRINEPFRTQNYKNNTLIAEQHTIYANDASTGNLILPKYVYAVNFPNNISNTQYVGNLEKKSTLEYDTAGNITQYTPENGLPVTFVWDNEKQLIAKIENATNTTVASLLGNPSNIPIIDLRNALPDAMVTTYTYIPLVGVSSITDPRGHTTTFEYDSFGRLKNVKDYLGKILTTNEYQYKK